jgi:ATP-binding cassette, subfamily B, multidrug efflux pump
MTAVAVDPITAETQPQIPGALRMVLGRHLGPYRSRLALIAILQTIQTTAALMLPTLNARIISNGVIPGDTAYIRRWGAVMLAVAVVQGGFALAAVYHGSYVAMRFGQDLRDNLYHQVTSYSAREVGTFGAPSLITRITNDVQQVQMLVVMSATMAIAAPITLVVGTFMALREDVGLSVVLVVAIPIAAMVLGFIVSRMVPNFRRMQDRIDHINRVLREQITGIRVVRAFVREPTEQWRFGVANEALTESSLYAGRLMALIFPTVGALINLASVGVIWLGGSRINDGDLDVGTLIAFLTYLVQILMSVVMATFTLSMIPRASVSSERIQEVLDTHSSVVPPTHPVRDLPDPGALDLEGVGFHYPGAEHAVLSDISFSVRPGQSVAIVGSTGAGKTSLVNLVLRLYDSTEGSVRVGGVDIRDIDPDVLWTSVGYVPQRPFLFSGTIASNLRYGKPDATELEMWEALTIAQAADFVRAMPGGLEARVEQGGTNVSGGQRQRLSIARALIRRPALYVFDDSFSALDLATDARLRAALVPFTRESAVVIVAQRVSTIMAADQIVVLDDGEMMGIGSHDELMASCETYAEIVESQIGQPA